MKPLGDQGTVAGFLLNVENSERLVGLAEDVRDAMMEYQVCALCDSLLPPLRLAPDLFAARYL